MLHLCSGNDRCVAVESYVDIAVGNGKKRHLFKRVVEFFDRLLLGLYFANGVGEYKFVVKNAVERFRIFLR